MAETSQMPRLPAAPGPGALHILTTLLYAGFAIPVTIIALDEAWPAGVAVAVIFAIFWPKIPKSLRRAGPKAAVETVSPDTPQPGTRPSGNASFDAYRVEMLNRLEQEQVNFESFLERLRDAKDQSEFDRFMDARAEERARPTDETPAGA